MQNYLSPMDVNTPGGIQNTLGRINGIYNTDSVIFYLRIPLFLWALKWRRNMEKLLDQELPKNLDLSVITLDKDCHQIEIANQSAKEITFQFEVESSYMIFWFPTSGSVKLTCSVDDSSANILRENYFLSSFPMADWSLDFYFFGKSSIRGLFLSLSKLHKLLDLEIKDDELASGFKVRKIFIEKDFHAKIKIAVDNP